VDLLAWKVQPITEVPHPYGLDIGIFQVTQKQIEIT
jgi:hypothetical protein